MLEYFNSATHLGLTATPKEAKGVSNITYFGDPIYTYSLKQGIEDGFLAPYKVIRIATDVDAVGYTPEKGKLDKLGQVVEQRQYNTKDFDRNPYHFDWSSKDGTAPTCQRPTSAALYRTASYRFASGQRASLFRGQPEELRWIV